MKPLEQLCRPNIWSLAPYSSARNEYAGREAHVFLDANENPYNSPYNRYPDPLQLELKDALSKVKGVPAENIFLGLENQVGVAEYLKIAEERDKNPEADDGYYLLDVREPSEVTALRLPHFINIPLGTLRDNLGEIPKDKLVLITCAVGVRAWNAARILAGNGYRTTVLSGGSSMYSLYVK